MSDNDQNSNGAPRHSPSWMERGEEQLSRRYICGAFFGVVVTLGYAVLDDTSALDAWSLKEALLGAGIVVILLLFAPLLFSAPSEGPGPKHPEPGVRPLVIGDINVFERRVRKKVKDRDAG